VTQQQRRIQCNKLSTDFAAVVERFQETQRVVAERERAFIVKIQKDHDQKQERLQYVLALLVVDEQQGRYSSRPDASTCCASFALATLRPSLGAMRRRSWFRTRSAGACLLHRLVF